MRENDLRVIKTRENIENAMLELLKTKRINTVTVTELSQLARISKGTFYLHYQDVYDLYEKIVEKHLITTFPDDSIFLLFFDAPERFFSEFDSAVRKSNDRLLVLTRGDGTLLVRNYIDLITEKLYATGRIRKTAKNDLLIQTFFAGLQHITQRHSMELLPQINAVLTAELLQLITLFE